MFTSENPEHTVDLSLYLAPNVLRHVIFAEHIHNVLELPDLAEQHFDPFGNILERVLDQTKFDYVVKHLQMRGR